jgi:hypothetical protein
VGITHLGTTYVIPPSYNRYRALQSRALSWVVLRGWRRSGSRRECESESDACGRGLVLSRAPCPRSDDVDHLWQLLLSCSGVLVLKVCVKRKEWGTDHLLALGRPSSRIVGCGGDESNETRRLLWHKGTNVLTAPDQGIDKYLPSILNRRWSSYALHSRLHILQPLFLSCYLMHDSKASQL